MSDVASLPDEPSTSSTPSTSNPVSGKPVVVRVKRKSFQSRLDAFCQFLSIFFFYFDSGWKSMEGRSRGNCWISRGSLFLMLTQEKVSRTLSLILDSLNLFR
ncbi:hypothetical protein BHM03_00033561 [Ensete ventricosum]|nr:hypothetical protein BHM03_00033561 [Ensete ventricosum]